MTLLQSIILAILEGITEFLPVSSTGHMIIASSMMNTTDDNLVKTFIVSIQLGAILSVVVTYRDRFINSVSLYFNIIIAFLPAAVIGYFMSEYIDMLLGRVDVVAAMLVLGGIVFLFVDDIFRKTTTAGYNRVTRFIALKIGFFQTLAMVPGVSRSAATIIGGLAQKLNKKTAAEFSFFLAVPTMVAATTYKLLTFYMMDQLAPPESTAILIVGNVVAFFTAMLAIRMFIAILTRYGFRFFGYYRIFLGSAVFALDYLDIKMIVF